MTDNFYTPFEVYKNLPNILGYRNLELSNGNFTSKVSKSKKEAKPKKEPNSKKEPNLSKPPVQGWLTEQFFMELVQWERFCIVEARDLPSKDRRHPKSHPHAQTLKVKTFFIILDKDFDANSADIAKMLGKLPDIESSNSNFNIDCIIISEDYLTIYSKKKMESYEKPGSETSGYVTITNQLHTLFMHDIFKRPSMPKFRIVPRPEEETIMQELLINKANIEKKSSKDPEMIILGALPNDLIEIIAFNENTAQMIRYGVVR